MAGLRGDLGARLVTVEANAAVQAIARQRLAADERIEFVNADADGWLAGWLAG